MMLWAFQFADFDAWLPYAVFGMFAAGAWWLLDFMASRNSRASERLDEWKNPAMRKRNDERDAKKGQLDKVARVLEKASPALAKPLRPTNDQDAGKLKTKLGEAGFRSEGAATIFLGLKFAGLIGGFLLGGGSLLFVAGMSQKTLVYSTLIAGLLFYLPDIVLWFLSRSRKDSIFLGLPDALDLLVVCVESGLGLDQAMRKVSDEMSRSQPVISEEFALSNFQLQVGRSRSEVLHELGARTGVDDLRALAAILIQADKFGSSVAQALRVQSDSMRTRRRQIAEEKAAKTAVKLIFPLVIFIFPGIFVVLVGPAAITMVRQMLPVMATGS
jgi:tight adherence protein C